MINYLAQIQIAPEGGFKGFGALGLEQNQNGVTVFATFISSAIGLITLIAIIWFVFIFLTGAVGIITSGGDKNSNESARKKISSGIIGLVITVFGILIVRLIGNIIGLGDILNFGTMFEKLIIR
mgnify:CR=1 FL=1